MLPAMLVAVMVEPPEKRPARNTLDQAVETKTDKGHASGYKTCAQSNQPFKAVPGNREVFELSATLHRISV